jgi:hypothetical protein
MATTGVEGSEVDAGLQVPFVQRTLLPREFEDEHYCFLSLYSCFSTEENLILASRHDESPLFQCNSSFCPFPGAVFTLVRPKDCLLTRFVISRELI